MINAEPPETTENPAAQARHIIRKCLTATLATVDKSGAPYASLVLTACDTDGTPIMLLSTLARHTRHLDVDARVSLLFDGTGQRDVPMTGPRVSVSGNLERTTEIRQRQRFLRRHEDASLYADFEDFSLFRLTGPEAHYVAGFGRVNKINGRDLLTLHLPTNDPELSEEIIIHHMNENHGSALDDMAHYYCGTEMVGWQMTGLDAEDFDLRSGGRAERIDFPEVLPEISLARAFLMEMTKASRK